jgi:hypothetical protein
VKTGTGEAAHEQTLKVVSDTEFFGPSREPLPDGLKNPALRPGANVWLRVGTGELANTVRDLRMYDPSKQTEKSEKPNNPEK